MFITTWSLKKYALQLSTFNTMLTETHGDEVMLSEVGKRCMEWGIANVQFLDGSYRNVEPVDLRR